MASSKFLNSLGQFLQGFGPALVQAGAGVRGRRIDTLSGIALGLGPGFQQVQTARRRAAITGLADQLNLTPQQRTFLQTVDPNVAQAIIGKQLFQTGNTAETFSTLTPEQEIEVFGKDLPGLFQRGSRGGIKPIAGTAPPKETTPADLALINARQRIFEANPNDPRLKTLDAILAKKAEPAAGARENPQFITIRMPDGKVNTFNETDPRVQQALDAGGVQLGLGGVSATLSGLPGTTGPSGRPVLSKKERDELSAQNNDIEKLLNSASTAFGLADEVGLLPLLKEFSTESVGQFVDALQFTDTVEARDQIRLFRERAINALKKSGKVPVSEQERLIAILPNPDTIFESPASARAALKAFFAEMKSIFDQNKALLEAGTEEEVDENVDFIFKDGKLVPVK